MNPARARFFRQLLLLGSILILTVILEKAGLFERFFSAFYDGEILLAFVAGFFFVSIFTVAPAGVALYTLAGHEQPLLIALVAAFGSVIGDYLLYRFVEDSFFKNFKKGFHFGKHRRIEHIFHSQRFHWFFVILGALIIISPFPDEAGLALLGVNKMPARTFIPLAFFLDFVGILLIVFAAG